MKKSRFVAVLLALVLMMSIASGTVSAQSPAYNTSFTTSITYQNVGSSSADITINFYTENSSSPIAINRPPLAAGAGTSVFVGNINEINPNFRGSAVLSSTQPVVATLVQVAVGSSTVKNRPLSNGFGADEGSTTFLIPTVLKNQFQTSSVFSVQNVSGGPVNLTVELIPTSGSTITLNHSNLPAGAAKYYDMGQISQISSPSFNGSARITANGDVVASALELSTTGAAASAFEGVSQGSSPVYMPSALCNFNVGGGKLTNTSYAVQNTGGATTNVTVTYQPGGHTETKSIAPGAKASFIACQASGVTNGYLGSATITSGQPIVAIGKVYGAGISSAFVGAPNGSATLALPYVRWSQSQYATGQRQRAFIAIQNVGGSTVSGAQVQYLDKNGVVVRTHNLPDIAPGAKVNSNAYDPANPATFEFGYYTDGTFGGGAKIVGPGGSQLVAVVRIASIAGADTVGEDYNGIPIQ